MNYQSFNLNQLTIKISKISDGTEFSFNVSKAYFKNSTHLILSIIDLVNTGNKMENLTVKFNNKSQFLNVNGTPLLNDLVWGYPNKNYDPAPLLKSAATTIDYTMKSVFLGMMIMNSVMSASSSQMWGMLNTIQIIFYFPIL